MTDTMGCMQPLIKGQKLVLEAEAKRGRGLKRKCTYEKDGVSGVRGRFPFQNGGRPGPVQAERPRKAQRSLRRMLMIKRTSSSALAMRRARPCRRGGEGTLRLGELRAEE